MFNIITEYKDTYIEIITGRGDDPTAENLQKLQAEVDTMAKQIQEQYPYVQLPDDQRFYILKRRIFNRAFNAIVDNLPHTSYDRVKHIAAIFEECVLWYLQIHDSLSITGPVEETKLLAIEQAIITGIMKKCFSYVRKSTERYKDLITFCYDGVQYGARLSSACK